METMEPKIKTMVEPTTANLKEAVKQIRKFADEKGYRIIGEILENDLKFETKSTQKTCRDYLTKMKEKMGMSIANRFLHFLHKKVYKMEKAAPFVEYSEKELMIKELRKSWKRLAKEANLWMIEYKKEKGDFYKTK